MKVSIGIDGVDSQHGGCTTHALYRLFKRLVEKGYVRSLLDYPYLVRLNPAVPRKTRGNGAVAIGVELAVDRLDPLVEELSGLLVEYVAQVRGDLSKACAAVVPYGLTERLREVYTKALTDFVHLDYLGSIIKSLGDSVVLPLGMNWGCVGALAALGWSRSVCTYELLVYRDPSYVGSPRRAPDVGALAELDSSREYETFCSYDPESGRITATPGGPDPVLLGIRGLDPDKLVEALRVLAIPEPIEGWMVFKTNQASGEHMIPRASLELKPLRTGCLAGVVREVAVRPGGDVVLSVSDGLGELRAAVFKETGLTRYARLLVAGDVVRLCGSVKLWDDDRPTLHVELLEVVDLEERYLRRNPRCPKCGSRMESAGRGKGYRCPKCGFRAADLRPEVSRLPRGIDVGVYLPGCGSVKHLGIPMPLSGLDLGCREGSLRAVSDFYRIDVVGVV